MSRLFLTTALACAVALPVLAATPAEGEKLAASQTYTWWNLDALKTLDPQKNTDVEGSDAIRQLFEGLMNEDAKGAMVPGVAESHEVSEDKLTYTFHLRDAKWSNGEPVTAGDFVYGWQRLVDPATASEYAWFAELANIAGASEIIKGEKPATELGVRAVDDRTLEVTLTQPTPYFVKMLSHSSMFPAPRAVIEAHGDDWTQPGNLVGNGAYTLVSHDLGVQATMKKSETYWDAANTILTDIKAVVVNDINAALTRYLAGELDRVDVPAGQFPRLQQEYPDHARVGPKACTYAYILNLSDKGPEALKDKRVRQALSLGMQRDVVVNQILQGGQAPAWTWTHAAIEGFEAPENPWAAMTQEERTEKAKALLAEAGHPDGIDVELYTSEATPGFVEMATLYQALAAEAGIRVTINRAPAHDYFANVWRKVPFCCTSKSGRTADEAMALFYLSDVPWNDTNWKNAEFDAAIAEARQTLDVTRRTELYQKAQRLIQEDGGVILPVFSSILGAQRAGLTGWKLPVQKYDVEFTDVAPA